MAKTIFYHVKRYPFIRSRYLIKNDSYDSNFKSFLEQTYSKYREISCRYRRIGSIIEFYISALSSLVADEKFLIGYLSLETLCSDIVDFDDRADGFIQDSIDTMKTDLRSRFRKLSIVANDIQISQIANKIAYKRPSILKSQKYSLNKFNVSFNSNTLRDMYEVRNALFHGDIYDKHKLFQLELNLFDLLDRMILTMVGWKGNAYMSKLGNRAVL